MFKTKEEGERYTIPTNITSGCCSGIKYHNDSFTFNSFKLEQGKHLKIYVHKVRHHHPYYENDPYGTD